jgi:D-alanine transaminase
MPEIIYLNGKIVSAAEAVISINDRGFLFGDSVYEVIRSYSGRLWALERHLRRLERSLAAIEITSVDIAQVGRAIEECCRASAFPNALVYLQITRGAAPRAHVYPADLQPTILITVRDIRPIVQRVSPDGVAALTAPDLRWRRCDIKSTNLLPNVLAQTRARAHGADEAILIDADGCITEASSNSVFWVEQRRLFTTPAGPEILPSITRDFIVEIARDEAIPLLVERVPLDRFRKASEVLLVGTTHEVCPVISLDGQPVGDGKAGPLSRRLQAAFRARVEAGDDEPR